MSGSRQISPMVSAGLPAVFCPATEPVVLTGAAAAACFGAVAAVAPFGAVAAVAPFGAIPLAMLLAGLEGIGGPTRVQVSPPQRKPSTQPRISMWSGSVGVMVE